MLYRHAGALIRDGHFNYTYRHMTALREAMIRGETPCDMTSRKEHICLLDDCKLGADSSLESAFL